MLSFVDTIERDEIVKLVVFGLACLLVAGEAAQAAQCGSSLYLELMSRAKTIDKISGTCSRAARRSHPIPAICKVCGPTVHQLIALEALLRKNSSCFRSSKDKKSIGKLLAFHDDLWFVKRGCGF